MRSSARFAAAARGDCGTLVSATTRLPPRRAFSPSRQCPGSCPIAKWPMSPNAPCASGADRSRRPTGLWRPPPARSPIQSHISKTPPHGRTIRARWSRETLATERAPPRQSAPASASTLKSAARPPAGFRRSQRASACAKQPVQTFSRAPAATGCISVFSPPPSAPARTKLAASPGRSIASPDLMPKYSAAKPIAGGPTRNPSSATNDKMATLDAAGRSVSPAAAVTANGKPTDTPKPASAKPKIAKPAPRLARTQARPASARRAAEPRRCNRPEPRLHPVAHNLPAATIAANAV